MGLFILKRLGVMALTALCLTLVVFVLTNLQPNLEKLAKTQGNARMSDAEVSSWLERNGYTRPMMVRYGEWLGLVPGWTREDAQTGEITGRCIDFGMSEAEIARVVEGNARCGVLQGDFGYSTVSANEVSAVIGPRLALTGKLMFWAFLIMVPSALAIGVLAGMREGSRLDRSLSTFSIATTATPEYVSGVVFIVLLASSTAGLSPVLSEAGWIDRNVWFQGNARSAMDNTTFEIGDRDLRDLMEVGAVTAPSVLIRDPSGARHTLLRRDGDEIDRDRPDEAALQDLLATTDLAPFVITPQDGVRELRDLPMDEAALTAEVLEDIDVDLSARIPDLGEGPLTEDLLAANDIDRRAAAMTVLLEVEGGPRWLAFAPRWLINLWNALIGSANFWNFTLPVMTIALYGMGYIARMTRASMAEVMTQQYIRTARLKGVSFRKIVLRHALRNALIAPFTVIMLQFPWLLTGVVIVESLFSYNGFGWTLVQAAGNNDIELLLSVSIVAVIVVLTTQLLSDIGYVFLNPRIRMS